MTTVDLAAYKNLYLKTAGEHLTNLKKNLETLKTNPADKTAVYEIFRLFHSLKSQNFFMGYQQTARLCKVFEDFFRSINDGKKNLNSELLDTATEVVGKIEASLNEIDKNNLEKDLAADITNFEKRITNL